MSIERVLAIQINELVDKLARLTTRIEILEGMIDWEYTGGKR